MIKVIDERIRRFFNSVRMPFRMVIGSTSTGTGVKKVTGEGLADEPVKGAELFQHYGFQSVPPGGTMGVAVALGGSTSHSMIVATEHAAVGIDLATGEVSVVHQEGHYIHLKNGRVIEVECDDYVLRCKTWRVAATEAATMDTPIVTMTKTAQIDGMLTGKGGLNLSNESGGGAAQISGTVEVTVDVIAAGISQVGHHHKDSVGGNTGKPVG